MAYVLGFIATDGCLVEHKNGYNGLNITNKNKNILKKILEVMDSNHKISTKSSGHESNLKYFQMQIRDKTIYNTLLKLGLTPRKSKTIRMPNIPYEFLGNFVRGCLDGDGTVTVWQDPRWRHPWQMSTRFISGSLNFLYDMQKSLQESFGLTEGSIQQVKRAHALCYSIADSVKLYLFIYKNVDGDLLFLRYKRDKFEFFKKVRPDCFETVISDNMLAPSSSQA